MRTAIAVTAVCCSMVGLTLAENVTAAVRRAIDIPPQPLSDALRSLADEREFQILYVADVVGNARTAGAQGELTPIEALDRLLTGTGLVFGVLDERTVTIKRPNAKAEAIGRAGTSIRGGRYDYQHLAQVEMDLPAPTPTLAPTSTTATTSSDSEPKRSAVEEVMVTGSHIRGATTASPVIAFDSVRIKEEGFTDMGEVIRSVPQNFNGGQNPGMVGEGGGIANQNITGGSALNLRGLGPDATLTLLNGRRLAYSGFTQAIDISAIPVEAIDHVEIIPDGASAIYGSDAVGGVGNVILKRDFEGLTIGARYGGATDEGLTTRQYDVTAGHAWQSGGLIATWKKSSSDPIFADQRAYTDHMLGPNTLYPKDDLRSGLLSIHQSFGNHIEARLDALRTEREQLIYYPPASTTFYPSPLATTTSLVSPSVEFSLPNDWVLSVGGAQGKEETVSAISIVVRATGDVIPLSHGFYRNKSFMYEIGAEGPLFALPGGDARLAVGAGYRRNEYLEGSLLRGTVLNEGDDSSRFAYAEINVPLIGPDQNIRGVQRLSLTAAARGEDYDSFGRVTTPKLGLIYDPGADFTLKLSWGKSFKAPTLLQRNQKQSAFLYRAATVGGVGYDADATVLMPYGGNPDLEPERARTLSATLTFHPAVLPELQADLSWFDIDYTDRISQPLASFSQSLSNPEYAQFIDYTPTLEEQARIIDAYQFSNFTGIAYDPSNVVAIAFNRYINTVAQRVKGFDLSGSYQLDLGPGRLTIRGSAGWLDSSQRTASADAYYDLSGTLFYPAKVKSRIGAVWSQGGLSAATFLNYVSGVTNTIDGKKSDSFTTIDATLRYATGARDGILSGLEFALSGNNLLDQAPPLYSPISPSNPPYDSRNYSAIGRFVSLSVSKHW